MEQKIYTRESLPALLRAHGISPTHQRIEIAHAILSRREHVSADRILALANDRATETSKDRKSTRLNSSHTDISRMPSSA